MSNIVISYPDHWHYDLVLQAQCWGGTLSHTLAANPTGQLCARLRVVRLLWLTCAHSLTQSNSPYASQGAYLWHIPFFPKILPLSYFLLFHHWSLSKNQGSAEEGAINLTGHSMEWGSCCLDKVCHRAPQWYSQPGRNQPPRGTLQWTRVNDAKQRAWFSS